ncbi:MAG: hydrogenase maturation peptidase HycI [Candidatus Omnitrophota bacterium]
MRDLKRLLKDKVGKAQRLAVLGIGSELRGDDAAGIAAAKELDKAVGEKARIKFRTFIGGTAPENLTGEIKKFNPTHLIMIDSAMMGKGPGGIGLIDPVKDVGGVSFSSHRMPLSIMANYLLEFLRCEIIIMGIEPKRLDFNKPLSGPVKSSVARVVRAIKQLLS